MTRADRAKILRRSSGFAEEQVWSAVRASRIDGWKFRRQHPIGPFVVDFACTELKLIIEIDGKVHALAEIQERDISRQQELEALGWTVLRLSNDVAVTRTTEVVEAVRSHAARQGRRGSS